MDNTTGKSVYQVNSMKRKPNTPRDRRREGFATGVEAGQFLGLSPAMITKLANKKPEDGGIPHRRYGRALRIPWAWLLDQIPETETAA